MDFGEQAIQEIYQTLHLDEKCSVRFERGFVWWAGPLAQTVWAAPAEELEGKTYVRLLGRTDFVKGFVGTSNQVEFLDAVGQRSCQSGLIRHPEDPSRIALQVSATLDEATLPWLPLTFSVLLALQNTEANVFVGKLSSEDGLTADASSHPVFGSQKDLHPALPSFGRAVANLAGHPSRFAGLEMQQALAIFRNTPATYSQGEDTRLVAVFPMGSSESLVQFDTTISDLWYGNGLQLAQKFDTPGKSFADVLEMNERESRRLNVLPGMGRWFVFEDSTLGFTSFYPNYLYARNIMENLVELSTSRALWFAEEFCKD